MIDLENIKKDIVNRVLVSSGKRTIHNEVMHGLGLIEELYQAEIKELKQKLARYENPDYVLVPRKPKKKILSKIGIDIRKANFINAYSQDALEKSIPLIAYKAIIEAVEKEDE